MAVQNKNTQQRLLAMKMHFQKASKSQILWKLKDSFGTNAVSSRTLSYWIKEFKSWNTREINREAPFELHRIEEYGLPIQASEYISEMLFELKYHPKLPLFRHVTSAKYHEWEPTVREVEWWWQVHNMAAEFSYDDVYMLSTHYVVRELLELISNIPANYSDLNAYLIYKPWKSMDRTNHYRSAIEVGKFSDVSSEDYGDRGIIDAEGALSTGGIGFVHAWEQPLSNLVKGKYLTPMKALVAHIHITSDSRGGLNTLINEGHETENVLRMKSHFTEEMLEKLFDEEELEQIKLSTRMMLVI